MEPIMEFLQNGVARRRNRRWPDEVKARIVAETLLPGASVSSVARRHGITANHISSWRGRAKRGDLVLPAPETAMEFASLVLGPSTQPSVSEPLASCPTEISYGPVTIRLGSDASAARIAAVVHALMAAG